MQSECSAERKLHVVSDRLVGLLEVITGEGLYTEESDHPKVTMCRLVYEYP